MIIRHRFTATATVTASFYSAATLLAAGILVSLPLLRMPSVIPSAMPISAKLTFTPAGRSTLDIGVLLANRACRGIRSMSTIRAAPDHRMTK